MPRDVGQLPSRSACGARRDRPIAQIDCVLVQASLWHSQNRFVKSFPSATGFVQV